MSPRSEELMAAAQECLRAARVQLEAGLASRSVSDSYYATLYAARAALSEEDRNAKTHSGTWSLFAETFVQPGAFDRDLARFATRLQETRVGTDYDAQAVPQEEAQAIAADAERFVAAVGELIDR